MKIKLFLFSAMMAFFVSASAQKSYTIHPVPQEQIAGEGSVNFTSEVNVVAEKGIDEVTRNRLVQVLKDHNLTAVFNKSTKKNMSNILLGVNNSRKTADKAIKKLGLNREVFNLPKYDKHILSLTNQQEQAQLVIVGENTDAVFFGLASLEQMLDRGTNNLPCVTLYDYADIKSRGVIEGYYGVPYSASVTKDLLKFMMRHKMNSYMYGAKSDTYHSKNWKDAYPKTITPEQERLGFLTQEQMRAINKVSRDTKVNFIWAIHPGRAFTGKDEKVIDQIMNKFQMMHELGVRQFAVFVDDIGVPRDLPTIQLTAARLTTLQNRIDKQWNGRSSRPSDRVKGLHFVPQLYAYSWQTPDKVTTFFSALGKTPDKVQVYVTGANVWSTPNVHDLEVIKKDLRRDVAWWWNYPCNDNMDNCIFPNSMYKNFQDMSAIDSNARLPKELTGCISLLSNPMQQGEIAKIPLFSVADYAWNNSGFDNDISWLAAIKAIAPKGMEKQMRLVCQFSSFDDSLKMHRMAEDFELTKDPTMLTLVYQNVNRACHDLSAMKNSPIESERLFYRDMEPWLLKLTDASGLAVSLLSVSTLSDDDPVKIEAKAKGRDALRRLKSDEKYNVTVLEGMGNGIGVKKYNVILSDKVLFPLLEELCKEK